MVGVTGAGVLVGLTLAVASSLALIPTPEGARADDEGCYWLNMEGISEDTQEATRNALDSRGWYEETPQAASMPSTARAAARWASLAVRHEASEAPARVFSGTWRGRRARDFL
jgi:hypothetical protein